MYPNYKRHLPKSYVMGTLIRRREDPEYATEMMNELGTTGVAIGDATVEIMITTMGKIPEEMYDLDESSNGDLTMGGRSRDDETDANERNANGATGFAAHSTLFIVLLVALLLLVTISCVAACIIARARKKHADSSDMECDADCGGGAKQPLISSDKMSESTSRSGTISTRN